VNTNPTGAESALRESVFRAMFEQNFVRVVRYVQRQVADRATAEDIAADVFRIAWEKLEPADPFGVPWLIRTAMHRTRDHQRRQYRGTAALTAIARRIDEQPAELEHLDRFALYAALQKLSPKDQEIVQLTYWDGLSAGEVASVLRMRQGAVWTRLHRARAHLRTSLDDSMAEGVNGERRRTR